MAFGTSHNGAQSKGRPPAKLPSLVEPGNVPTTMRSFPYDFKRYVYVGPIIDLISDAHGKATPCLLARLEMHSQSPEGASSQIDMVCSLRDLSQGNHPQTGMIGKALNDYYQYKVYGVTPTAVAAPEPAVRRRAPPLQTAQAKPAAQTPANFFALMNNA